jgi:TRAP-type C4-dicarboxylate transport system permease small subunit
MDTFVSFVLKVSKLLHWIAAAALTLMMCITVADVIGRAAGHPIMGTYEIVGLMGAIVIGFAVPLASWQKVHIYMEFLVDRLPRSRKNMMNIFTRLLCILLFVFIGYNMFQLGADYQRAGEVSLTLKIPIYPVVYGVAVCCFIEAAQFVCDILKITGDKDE